MISIATDGNYSYGITQTGIPHWCRLPCSQSTNTYLAMPVGGSFTTIATDGNFVYATDVTGTTWVCPAPCLQNNFWVKLGANKAYAWGNLDTNITRFMQPPLRSPPTKANICRAAMFTMAASLPSTG